MTTRSKGQRPRLTHPNRMRALLVEDHVWEDVTRIAELRGESVSAVVRDGLARYRKRHMHLLREQGGEV